MRDPPPIRITSVISSHVNSVTWKIPEYLNIFFRTFSGVLRYFATFRRKIEYGTQNFQHFGGKMSVLGQVLSDIYTVLVLISDFGLRIME